MLLDLSDLSNLLTVRFVKFKILGSSVKGVSPSFLAELQSKTINSPHKKKKKQELTLASRVMVLSLLYLLKYWPRPDRTRLRTSWEIINLRMRINRIELPRPLSGPRMCSGHSRCSRCSSYASASMFCFGTFKIITGTLIQLKTIVIFIISHSLKPHSCFFFVVFFQTKITCCTCV